jgi:hypothetical protein
VRERRSWTKRDEQTTKSLPKVVENCEVWTRTLLHYSCDFGTEKGEVNLKQMA